MDGKNRVASLAFVLLVALSPLAPALSEQEYQSLSGLAKQSHQLKEATRTHLEAVPWRTTELCMNTVAGVGLAFRHYTQNIVGGDTGLSHRLWRWYRGLTGKPVHRYGVTASALVTLEAGTGLLGAREVPATVRYSLANPFFPEIKQITNSAVANYRPGFMISFHIDGKPDRNLFLMPADGLDGFSERVNPLELQYTHRLHRPTERGVRLALDLSFNRAVTNALEQELDDFAAVNPDGQGENRPQVPRQLYFRPVNSLAIRFATLATEAIPRYTGGGLGLSPLDDRLILTRLATYFPYTFLEITDGSKIVGKVEVTSPFQMSGHGDHYYSKHPGFEIRR